mgnify:FL=1|tara:strand:+ start:160 stop:570 length:411 start_codon:yes stop_codon:yes gene_type:complete
MKKNIIITLIALSFSSFAFSGLVQPTISMRFNDVTADTGNQVTPTLCLGIATVVEEGVVAGFDSDGTDSRIFVTFEYGTMGLGINALGEPQFTVGGNYSTLQGLNLSLDYVINNLATDGAGNSIPNELRMSLGVTF